VQPDEETGSAEEQPASNMAASKLETVEYRSRSVRGGFNFTRMAKTEHSHPLERFNPFTIEP